MSSKTYEKEIYDLIYDHIQFKVRFLYHVGNIHKNGNSILTIKLIQINQLSTNDVKIIRGDNIIFENKYNFNIKPGNFFRSLEKTKIFALDGNIRKFVKLNYL
jgi:hypothetical protein